MSTASFGGGSRKEEELSSQFHFDQTSSRNTLRGLIQELVAGNWLTSQTTMSWPDWLQPHIDSFVQWVNGVLEYWDLDYLEYLIWLFLPIFIAFVLPIFLLFFIYGCVIFLHCYQLRHRIREAYASSYWDGARTSIASFWDGVGILWHGYEIRGLENLPDEGPGLIIAYHGTLPLDLYYVIAKGILYKKRTIHCVGDKFVFKIPGWGKMCKVFCITPGTVDDCIANLREGNLLIIAPGGVREALFSNPVTYEIMWGKRMGFAKVVLGANVPVIPMFTENCRDAFRTPRWGRRLFRPLYEKTRLPLCPIYGGFPVKMITHLGEPIHFPADATPEQVKHLSRNAVNDLILENQVMPGSILRAMLQRVRKKRPSKGAKSGHEGEVGNGDGIGGKNRRNRRRREAETGSGNGVGGGDKGETLEMRPTSREIVASLLLMQEDQGESADDDGEELPKTMKGMEEEEDDRGPKEEEPLDDWVTAS